MGKILAGQQRLVVCQLISVVISMKSGEGNRGASEYVADAFHGASITALTTYTPYYQKYKLL